MKKVLLRDICKIEKRKQIGISMINVDSLIILLNFFSKSNVIGKDSCRMI